MKKAADRKPRDTVPPHRGRRWASAGAFALSLFWVSAARAQTTYLCPPAPAGIPGLPGGPKFAEAPVPDAFASQLDDPRWTGAWREDFSASQSTSVSARILDDGTNLFFSLQATADPDGAQVGGDAVYLGFSADGTTAVFVKIVMDAASPASGFTNDGTAISTASWWKTTNGGASPWPKQGLPQTWATSANVHLWTGNGTGNGAAWAYNAKLSLADLGTDLGLAGPLSGPFFMWYQVDVETPQTTAHYAWPAGSTVAFDGTTGSCTGANPCAVLASSAWGVVNPTATSQCPVGISIGSTSIGALPLSTGGVPSTTASFGTGSPGNDFVAELTNTDPVLNPVTIGSIRGRFRIAGWPSTVGVGGSWNDLVTTGTAATPAYGTDATAAGEVRLPCVNPPFTSTSNDCFQLPAGAPAGQGLLVELSQSNGSGAHFVHDSAWVSMSFLNPSSATGGAAGGGAGGAGGAGGKGGQPATGGAAGGGVAGAGGQRATGGAAGSGTAGASGQLATGGAAGRGVAGAGGQLATGGAAGGGAGGQAASGGSTTTSGTGCGCETGGSPPVSGLFIPAFLTLLGLRARRRSSSSR